MAWRTDLLEHRIGGYLGALRLARNWNTQGYGNCTYHWTHSKRLQYLPWYPASSNSMQRRTPSQSPLQYQIILSCLLPLQRLPEVIRIEEPRELPIHVHNMDIPLPHIPIKISQHIIPSI